MRSHLKILMVVGLLTLMMPLLLGYLAGPIGAIHPNTIGDHANSKNITNGTCSGCHDIAGRLPNDPIRPNAHKRHFSSAFLNFMESTSTAGFGCGDCHEETIYGGNAYYSGQSYDGLGSGYEGDLSYTDTDTPNTTGTDFARAAMKQVKPGVCENCHGGFRTGQHSGENKVQTDPRGCVVVGGCHSDSSNGGDPDTAHDPSLYINQRYANSTVYCARCHGELAWYQTEETTGTLP